MDSNSDEPEISDSEIDVYFEKPYKLLRNGDYKVNVKNELRCPFCLDKKKQNYKYKELLAHASGVAKGSASRNAKHKANHLALAKYLENEFPSSSSKRHIKDVPEAHIVSGTSDIYVWPWMGIIMKPLYRTDNKNKLMDSTYWLKKLEKFNPLDVKTIWIEQDSIIAIVLRFSSCWSGFKSVTELEKEYEFEHCSKKDWNNKIGDWRSKAYGWCARADDYYSQGLIAEYMSTVGKLRSFSDILKDEVQTEQNVLGNLSEKITMKSTDLINVQCEYNEKTVSLHKVLKEKDQLDQAYKEGLY